MSLIQLKLNSDVIRAEVHNIGSYQSKFTGADLRTLQVEFRTQSEVQRNSITKILDKRQVVESLNERGERTSSWKIGENSYSYEHGSEVTTYKCELMEKENLAIQRLQINGLEFTPYSYEEEIDQDALIITAKAALSGEERDKILSFPPYFPVVRKGISDLPREMRFGRLMLWSRTDTGFKYELLLVERSYDALGLHGPFEPQLSNMRFMLAGVTERVDQLLAHLVEKGLLSESEKTELSLIPKDSVQRRAINLDQVDDLDEWTRQAE
jgi:hypothetical protein